MQVMDSKNQIFTNLKREHSCPQSTITFRFNKKHRSDGEGYEDKSTKLINSVVKGSPLGDLVIVSNAGNENPYVTLQNAVASFNRNLIVKRLDDNVFELWIDDQIISSGPFQNNQLAKKNLAEEALEKLKETCFFIIKKESVVNVSKSQLEEMKCEEKRTETSKTVVQAPSSNSIAHKIMLKMGWSGGGLGAQEQGEVESVSICENVNRQGFGTNNLMTEISRKLKTFSRSSNFGTLVFSSDFTKEERALIHKVARKFNLKSKSVGNEERKLCVSRKITNMDIVKELLKLGGEDGLYKLHIPPRYQAIL